MNSPGFMYESVPMLLPIVCLWKINVIIIIIIALHTCSSKGSQYCEYSKLQEKAYSKTPNNTLKHVQKASSGKFYML
jgi:hypothetical protein